MFPLTKAAVNVATRGIRQTAVRQQHHASRTNFHDKYGNILLLSGAAFCFSIWGYVLTQTGMTWNLSPVGKVTPREWRK